MSIIGNGKENVQTNVERRTQSWKSMKLWKWKWSALKRKMSFAKAPGPGNSNITGCATDAAQSFMDIPGMSAGYNKILPIAYICKKYTN